MNKIQRLMRSIDINRKYDFNFDEVYIKDKYKKPVYINPCRVERKKTFTEESLQIEIKKEDFEVVEEYFRRFLLITRKWIRVVGLKKEFIDFTKHKQHIELKEMVRQINKRLRLRNELNALIGGGAFC